MKACTSRAEPVFISFIRELVRLPRRTYYNKKDTIQSSVGMIFKIHSQNTIYNPQDIFKSHLESIQLLFTQRAGYQGDKNAYNVVFPGGQCDGNETDFQACKRQLQEQIQLRVDEQCIYLGQLPSNFYYLKKRGKKVYISCHVWCMKPNQLQWRQTLNTEQLRDSRWVDYNQLIDPQRCVTNNQMRLGILERMSNNYKIVQNITNNITKVELPELELGMDRNLWGLTLWLWSYTLQMAYRSLLFDHPNEAPLLDKPSLTQVKACAQHSYQLQLKFRPYYPLKYPVLGAVKYWHIMNRVRPFSYERPSQTRSKLILLAVIIAIIVFVSFI